jgi:hydroxyethylthiazole kinase-like uncharacterized protein yjeF
MRGVWVIEHFTEIEARAVAASDEVVLMRRAAYAVCNAALRMLGAHAGATSGRRVVLLVGSGNNGGDTLWAGAYLRRRGVAVRAVLLSPDKAHPAGLAALRAAGGRTLHTEDAEPALATADLVIDGIVGLSARGSLRAPAAELAGHITAPVLAVDLPSGLEADTGGVDGPAIRAGRTVTFAGLKPVHVLGAGALASGVVEVADIGIRLDEPDYRMLSGADVAAALPLPQPDDDKYTQGVVGVAAGSAGYPGAAVLATGAAVRTTSGMVRFAGSAAETVVAHWPEVVATGTVSDAGRVQAWAVGPGLGTGESSRETLRQVLGSGAPVIADADAITILAGDDGSLADARDPDAPLVLTPHAGEFARLAGELGDDRVAAAARAARQFGATVLLKGYTTVIAAPDGRVLINPRRPAWPATAGSGDVLTGMIGALASAGLEPLLAAGVAAYVHSLAAERAARGAPVPATGIIEGIPAAIRALLGGSP